MLKWWEIIFNRRIIIFVPFCFPSFDTELYFTALFCTAHTLVSFYHFVSSPVLFFYFILCCLLLFSILSNLIIFSNLNISDQHNFSVFQYSNKCQLQRLWESTNKFNQQISKSVFFPIIITNLICVV